MSSIASTTRVPDGQALRRMRPTIAVTCGEPAGIGPEISLRAAWALRDEIGCVLIGDAAFLAALAADMIVRGSPFCRGRFPTDNPARTHP